MMNFMDSLIFEKLIIPALSFFNEEGRVDFKATEQYIDMLNRSPIRKVILFGSTGEGVSLGIAEKVDLLRLYEKRLSARISITVCPGSWCIKDIETLVASDSRIANVLQLPTTYYDRYDPRLVRFYTALSHAIPQEIYLYHLPKNTLFHFTPQDVLAYRASHARIAGIKFSQSSLSEMTAFTSLEHFDIWYGEDEAIKSALEAGASGVVCQNLAVGAVALEEGDNLAKIQKAADDVRKSIDGVGRSKKIRMLKTVLREKSGLDVPSSVRIPNL
jgi:dihydrodipicolinate synthase/N-acetylneuraminate lyase